MGLRPGIMLTPLAGYELPVDVVRASIHFYSHNLTWLAAQLIAQSAPNGDGEFAVLVDGLGNYSRPISTKSELAQKFFDQGLRLIYGYYSPEATASFREALRHDPDNPRGIENASGRERGLICERYAHGGESSANNFGVVRTRPRR